MTWRRADYWMPEHRIGDRPHAIVAEHWKWHWIKRNIEQEGEVVWPYPVVLLLPEGDPRGYTLRSWELKTDQWVSAAYRQYLDASTAGAEAWEYEVLDSRQATA